MQAGLAERQRLQAAWDLRRPLLAGGYWSRVTTSSPGAPPGDVMFVDVRDFTPFSEANTAEDTVARLNACSRLSACRSWRRWHVNKFLGMSAGVFGPPTILPIS